MGVASAVTLVVLAVVVVVSEVSERAGTFVSPTACAGTTATNLKFEPATGAEGTNVYITGANFAEVTNVTFNGTPVTSFNVISATEITTVVPGGATPGPIAIVSDLTPVTSDTCFTTTSPAIASFGPMSGAAGTTLTISGVNLAGATAVKFNGLPTTPSSVTPTAITVTVPPNAVTGLISVTTPVSTGVAAAKFTVSSPAVTTFEPTGGGAGTVVKLTGANLAGATAVRFGATPAASFSVLSATQVTATVPTGVTGGPIAITTPAGTATASADFAGDPTITSFAPTAVAPGAPLTITGTNLNSVSAIGFAGSAATVTFTLDSPTQITATVPADAVSGPIAIQTTGASVASASPLTVLPSVTSFWPLTGPAGTVVTITGYNLEAPAAVTFNGVAASQLLSVSPTELTATVPAGATNGTIRVRTASGSADSAVAFRGSPAPPPDVPPIRPITIARGSGGVAPTPTTTAATTAPAVTTAPAATTVPSAEPAAPTTDGSSVPVTDVATTTAPAVTTVATTIAPAPMVAPSSLPGSGITLTDQTGTAGPNASGTPTWTGTATAAFGLLKIPVTLTYSSDVQWTLTASAAAATVSKDSFSLSLSGISGSVIATPAGTTWDLVGALGARLVVVGGSAAEPQGKLSVLGGAVAVVPSCPTLAVSTELCPTGNEAGTYLRLVGDATSTTSGFYANLGSGLPLQALGTYEAAVNLASAAFVLEGQFAAASEAAIGGVVITGLTVRVAAGERTFATLAGDIIPESGSANAGFNVVVRGSGRIKVPKFGSWDAPRISLAYANGGFVVVGSLDNKPKLGDASMSSFAYFNTQQDTTTRVLGNVLRVPPETYMFAGSMQTPDFLTKHLGVPKQGLGAYATYTTSGLARITAVIPASLKLPPIPNVKTTITSFTLTSIMNFEPQPGKVEFGYEIAANGTMKIRDNAEIALVLALKYTPFEFSIAISAVGANGSAVWPNIFGVSGLNLNNIAIQLNLTPGRFPFVGIGLAGTGSIPGKLREYMGIDSNAPIPISFVMNLASVDPCLSVSIGDPSSSIPIVAMPPGTRVVTATFFSLLVSPSGCSVGVFDVPAGVQIRAKTAVLSTAVELYAAYNPNATGPPGVPKTPSFRAWLKVDNPNNPNSDKSVRVDGSLLLSVAAGGWVLSPFIEIRGGIRVGGAARVDIFGKCSLIGCNAKGSGAVSIGGFNLLGDVEVKNLGLPTFSVSAAASMSVAGSEVAIAGSFSPINKSYSFSGSGTFPNGKLLESYEVSFAQNIETGYVPTAKFRASGTFAGRFKVPSPASGTFAGRFKVPSPVSGTAVSGDVSTKFTTGWVDLLPTSSELRLVASSNVDLGLITVPVAVGFIVCMTGPCAGKVTSKFGISSNFKGIPINIPEINLGDAWGFAASTSASFSGSDSVGGKWGGLRGTFSGSVTLGITSASGLTVDPKVRVSADVGAGGRWNGLGSYDADADFSGAEFRFCKNLKGRKICIP